MSQIWAVTVLVRGGWGVARAEFFIFSGDKCICEGFAFVGTFNWSP